MERTVNFGVIGCGDFAGHHLEALTVNERVNVVALCDVNEVKLNKTAERFHITQCYTDADEMLKKADIEAVIIATTDQTHKELTVKALRAGKHVLCEKPMALTIEDCEEMVAAEDETGKKLMIGQICRMTPGFMEAKRLLDEGVIGELFCVESEYAHDYTGIMDANSWRADPLRHIVIGGACHAIDLLRWIAGDPIETTAYSNKKVMTYLPTDDCVMAIFRFPNNVIGKVFDSCGVKRPYGMRTVLYGTKGTIVVNNTDTFITVHRAQIAEGTRILDGQFGNEREHEVTLRYPVAYNNHNAGGEQEMFIDAILEDKPVPTDGREGLATVRVCRAVIESADEHKTVQIQY